MKIATDARPKMKFKTPTVSVPKMPKPQVVKRTRLMSKYHIGKMK
jgi:hypothetical protein